MAVSTTTRVLEATCLTVRVAHFITHITPYLPLSVFVQRMFVPADYLNICAGQGETVDSITATNSLRTFPVGEGCLVTISWRCEVVKAVGTAVSRK